MDNCCRKCTKRSEGCHGRCEDYKEFVKQNEEYKEKLKLQSVRTYYVGEKQNESRMKLDKKRK